MAGRPSRDELLAVLAEVEDFARTLERFPGLEREDLIAILRGKKAAPTKAHRDLFDTQPETPKAKVKSEPPPKKEEPARAGKVVLWTDGASRGNPGPASIGVVIMSAEGQLLDTISQAIGRATNNHAEYAAVLVGLKRAHQLGAFAVELRADSELAVRQLSGVYQVRNPEIRALYEEAKRLEARFAGGVKYRHIPREQNRQADALANLALDRQL